MLIFHSPLSDMEDTMVQIKDCVACIHDLSEAILKGHMTLQSVVSLDVYLKSKVSMLG